MTDKELMNKIIELSPYSTIPNSAECEDLFNFIKTLTMHHSDIDTIEKDIQKILDYDGDSISSNAMSNLILYVHHDTPRN